MTGRIVVLGSVNMDLVLRCPQLPLPGQTVLGSGDLRTFPGGKGANQAVAAARLGAAVAFIGAVGDDDFGRGARSALEADGIDTAHLRSLAGTATGVALILVDEASGQNSIALAGGANACLSPAHVEAAAPLIKGAALLVCQLESPLPAVERAVAIAQAAGVPVLLNPAPAPTHELPAALWAGVDILVPNETEAATLLGLAPGAAFDPASTAEALRRLGPRSVVLTLGAGGVAFFADGMRRSQHLAAPRVRAVDTTGAGDTFIGAFAAARCAGMALEAAVAYGQRAAALGVTRVGAMASMPYRHELDALAPEAPGASVPPLPPETP